MQQKMLHLRNPQGYLGTARPMLPSRSQHRGRNLENRGQPMSEFFFVTVVAALVLGGLFTRSLLEQNWPEGMHRLTDAS